MRALHNNHTYVHVSGGLDDDIVPAIVIEVTPARARLQVSLFDKVVRVRVRVVVLRILHEVWLQPHLRVAGVREALDRAVHIRHLGGREGGYGGVGTHTRARGARTRTNTTQAARYRCWSDRDPRKGECGGRAEASGQVLFAGWIPALLAGRLVEHAQRRVSCGRVLVDGALPARARLSDHRSLRVRWVGGLWVVDVLVHRRMCVRACACARLRV